MGAAVSIHAVCIVAAVAIHHRLTNHKIKKIQQLLEDVTDKIDKSLTDKTDINKVVDKIVNNYVMLLHNENEILYKAITTRKNGYS